MKAFPVGNSERVWEEGMDLRDYFASKALQSLILSTLPEIHVNWVINQMVKQSYDIADAMMKAREK